MSEIHYVSYDPDELWEAIKAKYYELGGDTLYYGDEKEMLLRAVLAIMVGGYAATDTAGRIRTLRYATGDALDLIGETKGIARIAATAATVMAAVSVKGTGTLTIPEGTRFTANGTLFFENAVEAVTIGDGTTKTLNVLLTCTETGLIGNGVAMGTVMKPVEASRTILQAVLSADSAGGRDEETDDEYRERIRLYSNVTGTKAAYESKTKAVSTDIIDASATRATNGSVAIYLLLDSALSDGEKTTLIASVLDALNAETERPLTDLVTAQQATAIPYVLNITYRAPDNATGNVLEAIANAAQEYSTWQNSKIGRAFEPYKLVAMLYNAGAVQVGYGAGSNLNGGAIAYTAVDASHYLNGTVTLTLDES